MKKNAPQQQDAYELIQEVIVKLYSDLNESQQNSAKEALKSQDNHPTHIKGRSLVNLICHDFCLYKYPFKRSYNFDYEQYVKIYLEESDRFEWLIEKIRQNIETEWKVECEKSAINILYILSGAFTTETNNKNRQKKINDLRQILFYIFELNFICTSFTRPNFNPQNQYKQLINDVQQKIKNKLPFNLDINCDDMKNPMYPEDGFNAKPKQAAFKSWFKFLGDITIISIGESNKANNNGLLSLEILNLVQCFKESGDVLDYIEERLNVPSQQFERLPIQSELFFTMQYMQYYAKKNYVKIGQQLDELVEKAQQEMLDSSNVDSFIVNSNIKDPNKASSYYQDSATSIKSQI